MSGTDFFIQFVRKIYSRHSVSDLSSLINQRAAQTTEIKT